MTDTELIDAYEAQDLYTIERTVTWPSSYLGKKPPGVSWEVYDLDKERVSVHDDLRGALTWIAEET